MSGIVVIEKGRAQALEQDLFDAAPRESGVFCLLHEAPSSSGRFVLGRPLGEVTDWSEQEEQRLTPSGAMLSRAVSAADAARAGLAFIHTHPHRSSTPNLSAIDRLTLTRLARSFNELLDGPFIALVVAPSGWGGSLISEAHLEPLARISSVGRRLRSLSPGVAAGDGLLDDRQIRAIGDAANSTLRQLRVGVVGVGGTGSPLAETLVRMGIAELLIVDHDRLDSISNMRRVFGARRSDIDIDRALTKVDVLASHLRAIGLETNIEPLHGNVLDSDTRMRLANLDVLMCCTDNHASRAALTEFAVRSAMPLIDVGVRIGVRTSSGALDAMRIDRRVQVPGGPCLWCWDVIDPRQVRLELASEIERAGLVEAGYVAGDNGDPAASVAACTVSAAGLAASALLGLLSDVFEDAPLAASLDAITLDSFPLDDHSVPDPECICSRWRT